MKVSYVSFEAKEQAVLRTDELLLEATGDLVLVKIDYSALSAGTELANYHALPNTCDEGDVFPRRPGYSAVGRVVKCGPDVQKLTPGDTVLVHCGGHRSYVLHPEKELYAISQKVDLREAAFTYIASFAMLGVRKLNIQLGESVMVAGGGLLGLFAVQFARLSGAYPVMVCDYSPERRKLALELGADFAFDPADADFIDQVKVATAGEGPNAVVEVTGYLQALQQALEYIGWEGRITLLGCTRISDQTIDFYKYVHRRGIHLIGCHTGTRPKVESAPGRWTERDDFRTFLAFLALGRIHVGPMISQVVPAETAGEVYRRLGNDPHPPLGIVFDWRNFK